MIKNRKVDYYNTKTKIVLYRASNGVNGRCRYYQAVRTGKSYRHNKEITRSEDYWRAVNIAKNINLENVTDV